MEDIDRKADDRIPIWLDCDPGHDDAFAILLALFHPHIHLLGISTVHGNASLARCTTNTHSLLRAFRKESSIPVYPGAAKPFCRDAISAPNIHGVSGLDGTDLLPKVEVAGGLKGGGAVWGMREAILMEGGGGLRGGGRGRVWIVGTGAMTNVALLFATYPELVGEVAGVSFMGGAIGENGEGEGEGEGELRIGNVTRRAEFNVYCDPESASSIFSNPELAAKTILIPLDITHQVLATQKVQDSLLRGGNLGDYEPSGASTLRQMLHDLLFFFAETYASKFGMTAGPPLHDPVAVAAMLHHCGVADQLGFHYGQDGGERWEVKVVTEGSHTDGEESGLGATLARKLSPGKSGVRIPRTLNVEAFWKVIMNCVTRAEEWVSTKAKEEGGR
ncbi:MAG: Uridine nucleosidase 1 [Icmadophila ericetorum]|nr:Uridine nucleosidase 1 [Icmadophila ericetorum]